MKGFLEVVKVCNEILVEISFLGIRLRVYFVDVIDNILGFVPLFYIFGIGKKVIDLDFVYFGLDNFIQVYSISIFCLFNQKLVVI